MRRLDLGCGDRPEHWLEGADTVDMFDYGQTHRFDICRREWPLKDNEYDVVRCQHILEHIKDGMDFINILNEIWRVSKPGARFIGAVPHWTSPNFFRDPTHCRPMSENSFDMFLEGTQIHVGDGYGIKCKFRPISISINANKDVVWELVVVK